MSLDRTRRRRPRLAAAKPSRITRPQGLRRPTPTPEVEPPKPARLRRWLTRIGSWNWTAFASVIAALAAAFGVYYTGRSLDASRTQNETTEQAQLTDRFTNAVDQLDRAGPEHLQARVGAIYALERLARDSPEDQASIVEVLSAFIRSTATKAVDSTSGDTVYRPCPRQDIVPDNQAALAVLGRRDATHDRKNGQIELRHLCLHSADLVDADLSGADLTGTEFRSANLSGANLSNATLFAADLRANLYRADLSGTTLAGANLQTAYLKEADFSGARFGSADLSGANLTGANLYRADLVGTRLYIADLRFASFYGARVSAANLNNANLYGADLRSADFRASNFKGANLTNVRHDENTDIGSTSIDGETRGAWW